MIHATAVRIMMQDYLLKHLMMRTQNADTASIKWDAAVLLLIIHAELLDGTTASAILSSQVMDASAAARLTSGITVRSTSTLPHSPALELKPPQTKSALSLELVPL